MKRVHIWVTGKVQGVFFRHNTNQQANKLGLQGWVKNLPDGQRVEIVAEGEKDALDKLLEWCYQGSAGSRVDRVDVEWEDCRYEFQDFDITY